MNTKLYKRLAGTVDAYHNCIKADNDFWEKHEELVLQLVNGCLPHGSGIDSGVIFDFEKSSGKKLVFHFSYHFMDENGYYNGWEDYTLTVTPSLISDFELRITGKNRDDIKDYFYQIFEYDLSRNIDVTYANEKWEIKTDESE
jgi:hypothetical protein